MNKLETIKELLSNRKLKLSVGESCTGGLISSYLTDVDGASEFIEINFVAYSEFAKVKFLFVPKAMIDIYGVVSKEVAKAMARGLLKYSGVSISTTGYAGNLPSGDVRNPKGTVYYAFGYKNIVKVSKYFSEKEDRVEIKKDMAEKILSDFLIFLEDVFK